jgi:toxin HigB-1
MRITNQYSTRFINLYSVTPHYTLLTGDAMIETIKHKGLRKLYEKNDRSGIRPDLVEKVQKILSALEAANNPQEIALPLFRFHPLTGDRHGTYAVTVKANWRVTFRFHEGAAYDLDLEDYH